MYGGHFYQLAAIISLKNVVKGLMQQLKRWSLVGLTDPTAVEDTEAVEQRIGEERGWRRRGGRRR